MSLGYLGFGGGVLGKANAAADTVFYAVVPGKAASGINAAAYAAVAGFSLASGNTANAGYWLRPIGRANVTTAQTTSDATVTLDADPSPTGNTIAAGDQCVMKYTDGTYRRTQVNTAGWCSTTKVLTFTAVLPAAISANAPFFMMGVFTDTDPVLGTAFPIFPTTANTTTTYTFGPAGVRGAQPGDPLLFYCPNATNATVLNYAEYAYTQE